MSDPLDDLIEEVASRHGLKLRFDADGRCAMEHEDEFEILMALRDEGRVLAFVADVCMVVTPEPLDLFSDLLRQNMTGLLTGSFSFALDRRRGEVLLIHQTKLDDLDADSFVETLKRLVATRQRTAPIIEEAQARSKPIEIIAAAADGETGMPPEGDPPGRVTRRWA